MPNPFAIRPLAIGVGVSFFLHTALVLAVVLVPPPPVTEPPKPSEVTLAPQFVSSPSVTIPEPEPLRDAKLEQHTAKDLVDPQPVEPPEPARPLSLPQAIQEESAVALLQAAPAPEVPKIENQQTVAPAPSDVVESRQASEVATSQEKIDEVPRAEPGDAKSGSSAAFETRPNQLSALEARRETGAPDLTPKVFQPQQHAPLFPPDANSADAIPASSTESISLPVISSDDGPGLADISPLAVNSADQQAMTDAGPDGEASHSDLNSLRNIGRARPVLPQQKKAPPPAAPQEQARTSAPRQSSIYDPGVRVRYSSTLSQHLRRSLVFPTDGPAGTSTVRFILDRTGKILQLTLVGSSGLPDLDAEALRIVSAAAPFPRFPEGFGSSQLEVTLPVTFKQR